MYPGLNLEEPEDLEELRDDLEYELSDDPSALEIQRFFEDYVSGGSRDMEGVLYALGSLENIFPEYDPEMPTTVNREHDYPGEDVTVDRGDGVRVPFDKMRQRVEELTKYRHVVAHYDEEFDIMRKVPKVKVPQQIQDIRSTTSSALFNFIDSETEKYSSIVGEHTTLNSSEEFSEKAIEIFHEGRDLYIPRKFYEWNSGDLSELKTMLAENEIVSDLIDFNREIVEDLYGRNTEIPLRRCRVLNHEEEKMIEETGVYSLERNPPDSWSSHKNIFFREAAEGGKGIDIRDTKSMEEIIMSPHLMNKFGDPGEWIVNDNREEFTTSEFNIVHTEEAEFLEPEMLWMYEKLKETGIIQ
ncbi:MAG: hypothetical protein ABEK00_03665 [Candidatus Nanohaloarchaea archaeon]